MELHTIGIDLGKTVFHLVGLNQRGEVVVRKKFLRKQLLHFTGATSSGRNFNATKRPSSVSSAL
jgi:hypothetical protein